MASPMWVPGLSSAGPSREPPASLKSSPPPLPSISHYGKKSDRQEFISILRLIFYSCYSHSKFVLLYSLIILYIITN